MNVQMLILQAEEAGGSNAAIVGIFGTALVVWLLTILLTWWSNRNRLPERPDAGPRASEQAHDVADYEARSRQGQH